MHPNAAAYKWFRASQKLVELSLWADPVDIFRIYRNVDEVMRGKITGMGAKITSLLAIFLEELELIPYFPGSFPVDLWIIRISYVTGIMKIGGEKLRGELFERVLRPFYARRSFQLGASPKELSAALWLLGAYGCVQCGRQGYPIGGCPIKELCSGTIRPDNYRLHRCFSLPDDFRPHLRQQGKLF
jgi:hypothetical protein